MKSVENRYTYTEMEQNFIKKCQKPLVFSVKL